MRKGGGHYAVSMRFWSEQLSPVYINILPSFLVQLVLLNMESGIRTKYVYTDGNSYSEILTVKWRWNLEVPSAQVYKGLVKEVVFWEVL